MTPRTVTVQTGDHGPVTVDEPAWCTADHDTPQAFRTDISHFGPDIDITVDSPRGPAEALTLRLTRYPYTELPVGTAVHMSVCLADGDERASQRLMEDRRSAVYSTLHSILNEDVQRIHDHDARYIRRRTEATPVTYTVWQGLATDAEAGEGQ
jgi:hypothetical protein